MPTPKAEVRRWYVQKHIYICKYMWGLDTNAALEADTIAILMSSHNDSKSWNSSERFSFFFGLT